ncbi:MAG: AmmeMemoRadiSam system radical SAM enzyme, partial [Bacteroidota bacterium]|nr:AmmeMemoRadiSam system radical SAM enzyme [Bacteroidota bacterium]
WRLTDRPPTPLQTLRRSREIGLRNGLHYVYTGNVHDPEGSTTRCHACGAVLIAREGYDITRWALAPGGRCAVCGMVCAGVFEDHPGTWGSRRMPVRL